MPSAHCRTRPPLGAFGLTQSKCVKSGPYCGLADQRQRVVLGEIVRGRRGRAAKDEHARQQAGSEADDVRAMRCRVLPWTLQATAASAARLIASMTGRRRAAKLILVHPLRSSTAATAAEHLNTGQQIALQQPETARLLRQRRRAVRQLAQVDQQIGQLGVILDAGERHLVAGDRRPAGRAGTWPAPPRSNRPPWVFMASE